MPEVTPVPDDQIVTMEIPNPNVPAQGSDFSPTSVPTEQEATVTISPNPEGTAQADGVATPPPIPQPEPTKPILERNALGQITKGVAQNTNKNGTAGRPCNYCENKEEIQTKTQQYLDKCMGRNGAKPTIPYLEEIALELNTIDDVFRDWANKTTETGELEHPELNRTYAQIKALQKLRLKQRTMGRYNPTGAIFLLKANHGEIETSKQILAGDKNEPLQIEIIEEAKKLTIDE